MSQEKSSSLNLDLPEVKVDRGDVIPDTVADAKEYIASLDSEKRQGLLQRMPLLMLLYEKYWLMFILFLLPFGLAVFIFLTTAWGAFADYCGMTKGCDAVSKSVFGKVFGIPLAYYGALFYAMPLLTLIGAMKANRGVWLVRFATATFCLYPIILGLEGYLIYAQVVMREFCPFCSLLALLSFMPVIYLAIRDFGLGYWKGLVSLPRWSLLCGSFLVLHFMQHPVGSYVSTDSPEAMRRIDLAQKRLAIREDLYAKPYEVDDLRSRKKTAVMVAPSLEADRLIDEYFPSDNNVVVQPFQNVIEFDSRWVGNDPLPSKDQLNGSEVVVVDQKIEGKEEYSYDEILRNRIIGDESAPITLVVYFSYGCATCKNYEVNVLPKIFEEFKGLVKVDYRYHKISQYPFSDVAAISAGLAAVQGKERFAQVHHSLLKNQDQWMKTGDVFPFVEKYVDFDRFVKDMNRFKMLGRLMLAESKKNAEEDDVNSVPLTMIYVKGKMYRKIASFVRYGVLKEIIRGIKDV